MRKETEMTILLLALLLEGRGVQNSEDFTGDSSFAAPVVRLLLAYNAVGRLHDLRRSREQFGSRTQGYLDMPYSRGHLFMTLSGWTGSTSASLDVADVPASVLYNAFANVARMPEWSPALTSVTVDANDPKHSVWVMDVPFMLRGVAERLGYPKDALSWEADLDAPGAPSMSWTSTLTLDGKLKGLPNAGFVPSGSMEIVQKTPNLTSMNLTLKYTLPASAPRWQIILVQSRLVQFVLRSRILAGLKRFASVASREWQTRDDGKVLSDTDTKPMEASLSKSPRMDEPIQNSEDLGRILINLKEPSKTTLSAGSIASRSSQTWFNDLVVTPESTEIEWSAYNRSHPARVDRQPADLPDGDCLSEVVYAMYKPSNVVSKTIPVSELPITDSHGRRVETLTDIMLKNGVQPLSGHAGRLDKATSGLIFLSSHNLLNAALINQREILEAFGGQIVAKRYWLLLAGRHEADSAQLAMLGEPFCVTWKGTTKYCQAAVSVNHLGTSKDPRTESELALLDRTDAALVRAARERSRPSDREAWYAQRRAARVANASADKREAYNQLAQLEGWTTRVEVVLAQGRHHQVRRLCKRAGLHLFHLRRTTVGPVGLDGLQPGEIRVLDREEKHKLYEFSLPKLLASQKDAKSVHGSSEPP